VTNDERGLLATDSHRKTQTYLSPFVAYRLDDDFDIQWAPDTLALWGVACRDENAFAFSYAFAQWIGMVYDQRKFC
jgi:hypothetical protein